MLEPQPAQQSADVPDAVAPPPGNPRFPLFDSLRAVAALCILLVHAAIFSGVSGSWYFPLVVHLDIGVPFFFLLSGFLLYRPMLAARIHQSASTPIRTYAKRRFLRIAPAYWLALTVLSLVTGLNGVFTGNWWVYYGLLQNYPVYSPSPDCLDPIIRATSCGITPTWSLAIEVLFYISLPFFAYGMAWLTARFPRDRWLLIEFGALALLSAVSAGILGYHGSGGLYTWLFFSPLGRAWWFALGMGLAAISVWVTQRGAAPRALAVIIDHPAILWCLAAALYVWAALVVRGPPLAGTFGHRTEFVFEYLLFGVIAALVILPAIFGDERGGIPRRVLAHPTLAWLGLVSYGIFLWHLPVILELKSRGVDKWWPSMAFPVLALTTLAVTLVCASFSYYLLERPLMRRK